MSFGTYWTEDTGLAKMDSLELNVHHLRTKLNVTESQMLLGKFLSAVSMNIDSERKYFFYFDNIYRF